MFRIQNMRTSFMLYSFIIWQAPYWKKCNAFPFSFFNLWPSNTDLGLYWLEWDKNESKYLFSSLWAKSVCVIYFVSLDFPKRFPHLSIYLVISRDFLVQQSENLGIMSFNLLFIGPPLFLFVCFLLSHSVTFCFSPALSSPLSFCLAACSLSTLLAEAFRESFLAGRLGWWIICSTNLLRLSLPPFDPASASHTVETVFHWIFPVFCPCFSLSVTAQGAQMKQTCLTFPPLEIYKCPSWQRKSNHHWGFHFTSLPSSDS